VIVLLGATAAQAVFGSAFRISAERGKVLQCALCPAAVATWHPSSALRAPESADGKRYYDEIVQDLKNAAHELTGRSSLPQPVSRP
jgi:DNA polymerase